MNSSNPAMRLLTCARMIHGDFMCDIGTDHGVLPAYMLYTNRCARAIAADINEGPLNSAEQTLRNAGVLDRCDLYLTDGLEDIPLEGITDIVIAGMGGETIAKIMTHDSAKCGAAFILQPMSRAEVLRDFLAAKGFEVTEEKAVSENGFSYTVMRCEYTAEPYRISRMRRVTGLLSPDRQEDREYIKRQLFRMNVMAEGKSRKNPDEAAEIREVIDIIRKETGICLP